MSKIVITKDFQNQIDLLHRLVGNIEWSGVMFYTTNGIFSEKDCIITPKHIFPMDVGSSANTDFEYNEILLDAYDIFPDAENCREGIIHTHHTMGAFFSATDMTELQDNAKNYDWYLSLVVDFKQEYKAKVAIQPTSMKAIVDRPSGRFEVIGTNNAALVFDIDVEYEAKPIEDQTDPIVIRINKLINDRKTINTKTKDYGNIGSSYGRGSYALYDDYNDVRPYGTTHYAAKRSISLPEPYDHKKDKKGGRKVPLHYDFLAKWISQDPENDTLVFTALMDVVGDVEKFQDQITVLDEYGESLIRTFDDFFEQTYGETLEYYIETIPDLSVEKLIKKYTDAISIQKGNQRFAPIIEVILDALELIESSITAE